MKATARGERLPRFRDESTCAVTQRERALKVHATREMHSADYNLSKFVIALSTSA